MKVKPSPKEQSTDKKGTADLPVLGPGVISFHTPTHEWRPVAEMIHSAFARDIYGQFWRLQEPQGSDGTWRMHYQAKIRSSAWQSKPEVRPTADLSVVQFFRGENKPKVVGATFSIQIEVPRPASAETSSWLVTELDPDTFIDKTLKAVRESQRREKLGDNQLRVTSAEQDPSQVTLMSRKISGIALCRTESDSHFEGPLWRAFSLKDIKQTMTVEVLEAAEKPGEDDGVRSANVWAPDDLETPADLTRCMNMLSGKVKVDPDFLDTSMLGATTSGNTGDMLPPPPRRGPGLTRTRSAATSSSSSVSGQVRRPPSIDAERVLTAPTDRQTNRHRDIHRMFGLRAWPTPIVKPLWPFFVGAALTFYGATKLQDIGISTPEAQKDPKNPYIASQSKSNGHH